MKMKLGLTAAIAVLIAATGLNAGDGAAQQGPCLSGSYNIPGLKPSHNYVLAINGYSDHQSNKILLGIGELWRPTGEGYCDFANATTDKNGNLSVSFKKVLPQGDYKVKFLVKDPYDDWHVVWNEDNIEFLVN